MKGEGMVRAGYCMIKAFLKKLREDTVSAFAAQTAFFVILSFFPFLIFLLTLVRFLPVETERLLASVQSVFPETVHEFIGVLLYEVLQKTSGAVVSLSVITALWSASRGFLVIIQGMNAVYGNKETRNYFVLRFLAVGYTLVFAVILALTLLLLVFGNRIYFYI
ncbi:MAG: YihY/virulence factor BrkB family protein, partial [Lachnospiraceae bacterium]|nr:YihY/virulence factor BrkB family protein [Lachnospiraceae bacterium]